MPTALVASRLQFQDYQFQVALTTGIWKWTTRCDVSGSFPVFQIRDILSPYGMLRDSIPLPGEVVQSMSDSITTIMQSFAPSILVGVTSLSFTLNEGQGTSLPQPVNLSNNGVFGSLLNAKIASSMAFVSITPANLGGIASSETASFNVTADSSSLAATGSPYSAGITIQDSDATNSPQSIAVTIIVLPKAIITISATQLTFQVTAPIPGDPFPPIPSQSFNLSNTGPAGSILQYLIQKLIGCTPWLTSFTPFMGTLVSSQVQPITVVVAPDPSMLPGVYQETLRISGYSQNMIQDVQVTLVID